jgi:Flp pilus assembly pilin Flp
MARPHRPEGPRRWRSAQGATAAQYVVFILLVTVVVVIAAVLLYNRLGGDSGLTLLGGAL